MVGVKIAKAFTLTFLLLASTAKAEILFEGYARVFSKKKAIGYAVSRYEFDAKAKKFSSTYFMKIDLDGIGLTESLKATADEKMRPLAYSSASITGNDTKTIDAKFVGNKMTAQVKTNGKPSTLRNTLKPEVILSTFLMYSILSNPHGMKSDTTFTYSAIAEEEGQVVEKARAIVGKEEDYKGMKAFKIKNEFKGFFTSYVNARGEVLGTSNDDMSISTELMADPAKATEGFAVNKTILKALFGEVPEGKHNLLARAAEAKTEPAGKLQGAPQGQGIQIKTDNGSATSSPGSSSAPSSPTSPKTSPDTPASKTDSK